jgi:hypothetical protein
MKNFVLCLAFSAALAEVKITRFQTESTPPSGSGQKSLKTIDIDGQFAKLRKWLNYGPFGDCFFDNP